MTITGEVFEKVYEMKACPHWVSIDEFMYREYRMQWANFKSEKSEKRLGAKL